MATEYLQNGDLITADLAPALDRPRIVAIRQAAPVCWLAVVPSVVFGAVWLLDAVLAWRPAFRSNISGIVQDASSGQPPYLLPWFHFWHSFVVHHVLLCSLAVALIETYLALALILGFARKLTYLGGIFWCVGLWAVPEGFGQWSLGSATDVGTAVVYGVVFLTLWASDAAMGTRPLSVDAVIERRLPGWRRVAEVKQAL